MKKGKKETKDQKITDLTNALQRLQAEFENYKKRVDKQAEEFRQYASASVIGKLLPIIDTFELAVKNSKDQEKFKHGVELIYSELTTLLKNEGLEKIDALGKPLDPHLHDAMLAVESKKAENIVLEVLQEGYMLKDKVLRHAKVKVSK